MLQSFVIPDEKYVIVVPNGDKPNDFVRVDMNSGGYSYKTRDIFYAEIFNSIDQAVYYAKMETAKCHIIRIDEIRYSDVTSEMDKEKEYEAELLALKKKFGKA